MQGAQAVEARQTAEDVSELSLQLGNGYAQSGSLHGALQISVSQTPVYCWRGGGEHMCSK